MPDPNKTVFISYRRSVSSYVARAIFGDLRLHHYDVFMDVENIDSGTFDTIILNQIAARAHFLIICTPGTFERCHEPDDWLRREIEAAIQNQRNIIPIMANGFDLADNVQFMIGSLEGLPRLNGLPLVHDYFEEGMKRLRSRYLKQPVAGALLPVPAADLAVVQQKIDEVAAQPAPTSKELTAEEYFSRALARSKNDLDGKIADYSEAIRLNPGYAAAYTNLGNAHRAQGDLEAAIADSNEAIRLNPNDAFVHNNLGAVRFAQGDLDAAITNYSEAIHLNPKFAEAYNNRGTALYNRGDLDAAITDYSEAIRINPSFATAYNNRGNTRSYQGDFIAALKDLDFALSLDGFSSDILDSRGQLFFAMSQFTNALREFEGALGLNPNARDAKAGRLITLYAMGRITEAQSHWRELLQSDSHYRDADWVGKKFGWRPELIEEARKLITSLGE